jgi:hypothetical protein
MAQKNRIIERYVGFILRHRLVVLLLVAGLTGLFGYHLSRLRIATDFISFYPPGHEYIQLYNQYRDMLGSANVLVIAVEVKDGDIYNWNTLDKIDRITREMLTIKGCNPTQLISVTHPKLKDIKVTSWGIAINPLLGPTISRDDFGLEKLKTAIYTNEGIRGFYVSPNDKTAAIYTGFWEEGVNPFDLYKRLKIIEQRETDANHRIHFTGYPALYSYIYHLAPQVYIILMITALVLALLLFYYFRTWQGVVFPCLSALLSAVWGLGFASLLGYSLDPLVMVVPLIITARAVSHSVQCMARYHEEYLRLNDKRRAIIKGYGELFAPATLSIATDAIGVLLIAVATIPLMRHLGFYASFWILSIVVSVLTLSPMLLSFVDPPKRSVLEHESRGRLYNAISMMLLKLSLGKARWAVLGITIAIMIAGGAYASRLKVGDTEAGAAILFPDHPYNQAFRFFNDHFVGATQMVIVAEGKEPGAVKNYETLKLLEEFQYYMEEHGGAGGSITFNNMIKTIYKMFHEGHPKWQILPRKPRDLGQVGYLIRNNAAPGEMDQYLDYGWNNATITCFYKNYSSQTITDAIDKARQFIAGNPSEKVNFRLAGGLVGILAAVNEEVAYSYWVSMIVVFSVVFVLCVLTFKSLKAGIILIIPLALSQVLIEVFMLIKGIDLNINSLPVAAIAVGIGIDYGIYLMSRIIEEYRNSGDYNAANRIALATTGKAIIFTATTLVAGVIFWVFLDLKFQAEMGLLLGLLMLLNMIAALVLIPTLIPILKPKFALS